MDKKTELEARLYRIIRTIMQTDDEDTISDLEMIVEYGLKRLPPNRHYPPDEDEDETESIESYSAKEKRNATPVNPEDLFENDLKEYMEAATSQSPKKEE